MLKLTLRCWIAHVLIRLAFFNFREFGLILTFFHGFDYHSIKTALSKNVDLWSGTLGRLLGAEPNIRLSFKNSCGSLELDLLNMRR